MSITDAELPEVTFPEGYTVNVNNKVEGLTPYRDKKDTMVAYYDVWAQTYDKDVVHPGYAPSCETLKDLRKMYPDNRGAVRILDVGAGTGLVGEALYKEGFTDLDALDPSPGMLEGAAKKNVYKNLLCEFLDENHLPVEADTYDVCLVIGCIAPGHVTERCFEELIRITKPGGKILLLMRERFIEEPALQQMEPTMKQLAEAGKWNVHTRRIFDGYLGPHKGIVFVFEVL